MTAKGGISKGKSHHEGGIPLVVKSTGQQVELEGGEGVINKRNMASEEKFEFEGKRLTTCEIASEINQANGNGVAIDCDDIIGKKYKYDKGGNVKKSAYTFEDYQTTNELVDSKHQNTSSMNDADYTPAVSEFRQGGTTKNISVPKANKMFHLPLELAVYVPSTQDVDKVISESELEQRVSEVSKYLASTFGGFTKSDKIGGYLSSKSEVVTEDVVPVTSFATREDFESNKDALINKMSDWAKEWGQEAIGFEFEGDMYYVPQNFKRGGAMYDNGGGVEKRIVVVLDEGNGKIINDLFNQWNNIKSSNDYENWVNKVKTTTFGTYGTIGINDVLDKFAFDSSKSINELTKRDFKKELKNAISKDDAMYDNGGGVDLRQINKGDAVLYKDKTWYYTERNGDKGIVNMEQGAWGSDYPFVPIEKIDMTKITDMNGDKIHFDVDDATMHKYDAIVHYKSYDYERGQISFNDITAFSKEDAEKKARDIFNQERLNARVEYVYVYDKGLAYSNGGVTYGGGGGVDDEIGLMYKDSSEKGLERGVYYVSERNGEKGYNYIWKYLGELDRSNLPHRFMASYKKADGTYSTPFIYDMPIGVRYSYNLVPLGFDKKEMDIIHSFQEKESKMSDGGAMYRAGGTLKPEYAERLIPYQTFSVDFYLTSDTRNPELEGEEIEAKSLEKAIEHAKAIAYRNGLNYFEIYQGNLYLGNVNFAKSQDFIEGKGYKEYTGKKFDKGGKVPHLTERDFVQKKSFEIGNTRIKLEKPSGKYYRVSYYHIADGENGELWGSYGSPNLYDVIQDINQLKFDSPYTENADYDWWKERNKINFKQGGDVALQEGTKHELEHSDTINKFKKKGMSTKSVAMEIAKDHLKKDKDYYKKLDMVEHSTLAEIITAHEKSEIKDKNRKRFDMGGNTMYVPHLVHIVLDQPFKTEIFTMEGKHDGDTMFKKNVLYKMEFLNNRGTETALQFPDTLKYVILPNNVFSIKGYDTKFAGGGNVPLPYESYKSDLSDNDIKILNLLRSNRMELNGENHFTIQQKQLLSSFRGTNLANQLSTQIITKMFSLLFKYHSETTPIKRIHIKNVGTGNMLNLAPTYIDEIVVSDEYNMFMEVESQICRITNEATYLETWMNYDEFTQSPADAIVYTYPTINPMVDVLSQGLSEMKNNCVALCLAEFTSENHLNNFVADTKANGMVLSTTYIFDKINEGVSSKGKYTLIYFIRKSK